MFKVKQILGINSKEVTGFMLFPKLNLSGVENYGLDLHNDLNELINAKHVFAVDLTTDEEAIIQKVFLSYNDAWNYHWKFQAAKYMNAVVEKFKNTNKPEKEKSNVLHKMEVFEQQCVEYGMNLPEKIEVSNGKVSVEVFDMAGWQYKSGNKMEVMGEISDECFDSMNITPVPLIVVINDGEINPKIMKKFNTNPFFRN